MTDANIKRMESSVRDILEEIGEDLPLQQVECPHPLHHPPHLLGNRKDGLQVLSVELFDGEDVLAEEPRIPLLSEGKVLAGGTRCHL